MLDRVRDHIRRHNLVVAGDRVIVAVSGGPDSIALLHLMHRLSGELGISLHVFHMDHGLRGEASAEDALFVRRSADQLCLPSTIIGLGPDVLKRRSGSLQANARVVRYEEIEALAARLGATRVALGHHRNDQAETVIMRFLRGAGLRGLAGIPPVRAGKGVTYIRPLLEVARREIETYCREHELSPRLDESNLKPNYLRNRIRLTLLPLLAREYNPAIVENLSQMAGLLREEESFLEGLAEEALTRCRAPGEGVALAGSVLLNEPLALARRVVRMAARVVAGPDFDLGLEAVTQVLEAAARVQGTHHLHLPEGLNVTVEYGLCRFQADPDPGTGLTHAEWPVAVTGETGIPELGLRIVVQEGGTPSGTFEAAFDADRLPGPLAIRLRRPGDRLRPAGMEGSKKLQDILVDAKVPQRLRDRIPLLVAGGEVLWAVGYRLDRRFLATSASENVLLVRVIHADADA